MKLRILLLALVLAVVLTACKKGESYNESTTATTDTYATNTNATTTTAPTTGTVATTTIGDKDKDFIVDAGKGGKAEVEVDNDALAHAQDAGVKSFAQKLVTDHTAANDKLAGIATSKGVTIPSEIEG